jgi:predicted O-methyltransferase YrrM
MNPKEIIAITKTVVMNANLSALLLLRRPREAAYYASECGFLKRALYPNRDLPQRHVYEVFGNQDLSVTILPEIAAEWMRPVGSFTADLLALCMICRAIKPKMIFEIGTFHGAGTLHLAANAPEAEVFTLDLPLESATALNVTTVDRLHIAARTRADWMSGAKRISRVYGDSATFDFSPWRGKIDLFFIDGAHSYEYVRNDTMKGLDCCRPNGVIAWHDYGRVGVNGVSRWLHEFARQGRQVFRAPGGSLAYYIKH